MARPMSCRGVTNTTLCPLLLPRGVQSCGWRSRCSQGSRKVNFHQPRSGGGLRLDCGEPQVKTHTPNVRWQAERDVARVTEPPLHRDLGAVLLLRGEQPAAVRNPPRISKSCRESRASPRPGRGVKSPDECSTLSLGPKGADAVRATDSSTTSGVG